MNKLVVTMTAKASKTREVIAGLKALGDYARAKFDSKGEAYMQVLGGTSGTFYVIVDYKDLASAQEVLAKVYMDEKYMALTEKLSEALIDPPTIAFLQQI